MGHGGGCSNGEASLLKPNFDEPEIGKSYHTGQDMAADLAVGPVSQGIKAHEIAVFGLAKGFFDHVPIKACLDDLVGGPIEVIGEKNVLAKSFDVEADPIVILAKQELPLSFMLFQRDLIEIFGQMEAFTSIRVVFPNAASIGPMRFLGPHLRAKFKQRFLQAEELFFEGEPLPSIAVLSFPQYWPEVR